MRTHPSIKDDEHNHPESISTSRQNMTDSYEASQYRELRGTLKFPRQFWLPSHLELQNVIARSPTRQIACTYTPLTVPTHLPNGWWFLIERPSTADGITADICFVLLIRTVCTLHTSTCLCQKKTAHTAIHHPYPGIISN